MNSFSESGYEVTEGWGKHFLSPFVDVACVCVDSKNNVFVLTRGVVPVLVLDQEGRLKECWGREHFSWPHSIYLDKNDFIYCTDGDHTVKKFSHDGELLMTLGKMHNPSETGCANKDYRTIKQEAGPFNYPTDTAIDKDGNIYVSDGYGNARIHKFTESGEYILSWGKPGRKPRQFSLPHAICIDENDMVYVADRENSRIQLFDLNGVFLDQWDANRPTDLFVHGRKIFVTELGYRAGKELISTSPKDGFYHARLSIFTLKGELVSRWGSEDGCSPGNFFAPHALCVDSIGDIYVGELVATSVGNNEVPINCHALQKFSPR